MNRPRIPARTPGGFPALRVLTLLALLCIVPLALLSYTTIHLADGAVVREVNARMQTTAEVTSVLVHAQVDAVADLTASYARRPYLIAALADGNPGAFNLTVIDRHLGELAAAQPGNGGVFFTDMNCRLTNVQPATPEIVGVDFSFRDWCQGLRNSDGPYVSDAYQSAITGHPLVVAAAVIVRAPSNDGTGRPLGIIAVVYTVDAIKDFAAQVARAQGIHLTVTDKRGTVLTRPDGPDKTGLVSALGDHRITEALAGRSGTVRTKTAHGEVLSAFAPVRSLGWTITADVPTDAALAGVGRLRAAILGQAGPLGLVLMAGVVLLVRTLRQRREADRLLQEGEVNTRAILQAATDAFVSMDAAGNITGWNEQAEAIFGWPEAEALGRRLSDRIVPAELREAHERGLTHFLATGEGPVLNKRIEIVALHREGHQFPVELAIWPIRVGEAWIFNAFVHDITDRKRAETNLAEARDQALEASQKAHEASQMKSEFLANMSHEIRTPMNGVLGMTSLLLDTDLTPEQREFAETVTVSGEALLAILNDILDFSKIEAGRLDLESVDFDIRHLVEDIAGLLSLPAHNKSLEFACSLPDDLPDTVRGDPLRLRQIVTNLVGNAVKFTASGEVLLKLTMTGVDDETMRARFEVSDTGIGIDPADQVAMFESFSQADVGTTRRYGGTGLGLAISRQLVELMGGEIGVRSQRGQGSTFWFTVPLERGGTVRGGAPKAPLTERHILVVDDNATNRAILTRFLRSWGIRSEAVEGGTEALEAITRAAAGGGPFDAALLDLNMPEMDGIELARRIAADRGHPPVKLVLLTSSGQRGEADRAREAGISAYLTKPVRQSSLFDCLATVMAGPRTETVGSALDTVPAGPARPAMAGKILLAEDNPVNRQVAMAMLKRLGFLVDVAVDGAEAVNAASLNRYRAILMDCQMPILDGYEATREIRSVEGDTRHTPVIAVTAAAMKSDPERCLAAGMDDYLAKPLSLKTISAVLERWAPEVEDVTPDGPPASTPLDGARR